MFNRIAIKEYAELNYMKGVSSLGQAGLQLTA
jgi:hypothetical protein